MITAIQPNENSNGYNYEYTINGEKGTGYLTYNLNGDLSTRTLLLTHNINILNTSKVLKEYQKLEDEIQLRQHEGGAFYIAKRMVNDIHNRVITIPNVTIAVHRYGPVPVFVLPETFTLEFGGKKRKCNIGIYPMLSNTSPFLKTIGRGDSRTKIEFLKSLKLKLNVILRRYLEDIAENLFDIEHHSDLAAAFKKAKNSERILSGSISSKIDLIFSTTVRNIQDKNLEEGKLKSELENQYNETIFLVLYAKYYVYFFINEFYKMTGFSTIDYVDKFRKLRLKYKDFDKYFENNMDLTLLQKAITYYVSNQGELILDSKLAEQTSTRWVKRFIEFTSFINCLRNEDDYNPHSVKIFLSNKYSLPFSKLIQTEIEKIIATYFSNRVQLLARQEDTAGKYINQIIKSRIWKSEATYTVLSKTNELNKTSLDWVVKESIHTEVLQKQLLLILNKSDLNDALEMFKKHLIDFNKYLDTNARGLEKSKTNLIEKSTEKLHVKFDTKLIQDTEFIKVIKKDIITLIEHKVVSIIRAWLNQFDDDVASIILKINRELIFPCKISEAANRVFGSNSKSNKKKFNKVWSHLRNRKLIIDGKTYLLVSKTGKTSSTMYKQNIPIIVQELLGSNDNLEQIIESCYSQKLF